MIDEARIPLVIAGDIAAEDDGSTAEVYEKTADFTDDDYGIDDDSRNVYLTDAGADKAESVFSCDIYAAENTGLLAKICACLKARVMLQEDKDYILRDGAVILVDEFTGRAAPGRVFPGDLQAAVEAKHGLKLTSRGRIMGNIALQYFLRLFPKLAGMTGTAIQSKEEFDTIYGLPTEVIPTRLPCRRTDHPLEMYFDKTEKRKAVIEAIREAHGISRPVLVGTESIGESEELADELRKLGIECAVLNAKNDEAEADIISRAGEPGAVTISTNMAGRGTDIMLGGNAEYLAKSEMKRMQYSDELIAEATGFAETDNEEIIEARKTFQELEAKYKTEIQEEADKVRAVGGLFILGTERHDSRRIDNQLRGRSGRQGDPGESQFFLSLEDDLMRLFGGERMQAMMARLTDDENMPIESKMITRTVESSQKKVEGRNFGIRKQTLQYDDVMNRQRQLIYQQRDQVLDGIDLTDKILQMLDTNIEENVKNYFAGDHKSDWNVAGLKEKYKGWLTTEDDFNDDVNMLSVQGTIDMLQERGHKRLEEKRELLGDEMFQDFERMVLLRNVDVLWMDHIDAMDDLKQGIHLRAYAQQDPVVAFRMESYDMFDEMTATIRENTVRMMLTIMPRRQEDVERKAVAKVTATSSGGDDTVKQAPVRKGKKVGPNDPCPCGSGKKYKKCCGAPGKVHNN